MTKKIKADELIRRLYAPGAKIEEFAQYFKIVPDESAAFQLKVVYDTALIDMGGTAEARQRAAVALPGFNALVRIMRRGQFELKMIGGYDGPVLVAEGDSWFTYPKLDVIGALNDRYAISHLAAAGDTLTQMLEQDEYLEETQRVGARILLLSGGGNDALGGGNLKVHLRSFDAGLSPAQHVKSSFNALVDGAVKQFDQIFRRIAREAPGVTAICHGYDYAIPAKGKWLGNPMLELGIAAPAFQRAIVKELIDRFTLAIGRLAARYPHVVFLDNRDTVADDEWTDELHPNPAGFKKVAAKFDAAIKTAASRSRSVTMAPSAKRGRGKAAEESAAAPEPRRGLKVPTRVNRGYSLHIGLNVVDPGHYGGPQTLYGCHNDAKAMASIATESGYDVMGVLLDHAGTVKAVQTAIRKAAKELSAGDIFLITYAGHGSSVPDYSGDELDDGRDETWCLFDRELLDDELYAEWLGFREGVRVLVVSDSCHSGSVIRATAAGLVTIDATASLDAGPRARTLPDDVRRQVNVTHQALYRSIARGLAASAGQAGGLAPRSDRQAANPLGCSVRLLSGCMDNQTSGDGDINGLFTSRLLQVLEQGFRGDYAAFHKEIVKRMPRSQTPNHWVVGRKDAAFDGQQPFEI
ncbi:caspase family protein [Roseomonas sp. CAU 1739]|uniref:caspase family protein n=1 Tax=Roseomonas sp. CAU 1739 TaxID=3140364 RepID=UPI00325A4890